MATKNQKLRKQFEELRNQFNDWYGVLQQMQSGASTLSIPEKWLGIIPMEQDELHNELTFLYMELENLKKQIV